MTAKLRSALDEIIKRNRTLLHQKINERRAEMTKNNIEHFKLYELLGFSESEGRKIDLYQNIGRFLYKYAGSLIEEATLVVLEHKKQGRSITIPNTISPNPKNFKIDSFIESDNKAHEVKWRDATTDGDHVRKEFNKIKCIVRAGIIPVRVMYFMPNREQAMRIQKRIIETYRRDGEAYIGKEAWHYISDYTGFDLYTYLYRQTKNVEL